MSTNRHGYVRGGKCSFCGKPLEHDEGGHWQTGESLVCCCPSCAVNVLPALIADSLEVGEQDRSLQQLVKQVEANLLRAFRTRLRAEISHCNGCAADVMYMSGDIRKASTWIAQAWVAQHDLADFDEAFLHEGAFDVKVSPPEPIPRRAPAKKKPRRP